MSTENYDAWSSIIQKEKGAVDGQSMPRPTSSPETLERGTLILAQPHAGVITPREGRLDLDQLMLINNKFYILRWGTYLAGMWETFNDEQRLGYKDEIKALRQAGVIINLADLIYNLNYLYTVRSGRGVVSPYTVPVDTETNIWIPDPARAEGTFVNNFQLKILNHGTQTAFSAWHHAGTSPRNYSLKNMTELFDKNLLELEYLWDDKEVPEEYFKSISVFNRLTPSPFFSGLPEMTQFYSYHLIITDVSGTQSPSVQMPSGETFHITYDYAFWLNALDRNPVAFRQMEAVVSDYKKAAFNQLCQDPNLRVVHKGETWQNIKGYDKLAPVQAGYIMCNEGRDGSFVTSWHKNNRLADTTECLSLSQAGLFMLCNGYRTIKEIVDIVVQESEYNEKDVCAWVSSMFYEWLCLGLIKIHYPQVRRERQF